ncbi:MAG: alpha/beta fold hydrolase [Cellulomonas sp.]
MGVDSDLFVRSTLQPVRGLAGRRRLVVLDRWSGLPEGLTLRDFAVRYAEAIAELGSPVDVLGVSTGGSIAQLLAAEHPQRVRRLALVSTGCRLSPEVRASQAEVARLLGEGQTRAAVGLLTGDVGPRVVAPLTRWAGSLAANRLVGGAPAASDLRLTLAAEDEFDLARAAGRIDAPTLVVGGRRDRFYPVSLFEETARLIPHSQLVLRAGRGHVTVVSDPRTITDLSGFFTAEPLEG